MATETKRGAHGRANILRHTDVWRIIEIALRIGVLIIDRRRDEPFIDRQGTDRSLQRPRRTEQMAGH